jgi:hypothetical protein
MATLFIRKTARGFDIADDESRDLWAKYKTGEIYRADVVRPRSYQHHKFSMALLRQTWLNLPERLEWPTFDAFRLSIADAAGQVIEYTALDGTVKTMPRSLSYDSIPDDVEFGKVAAAMLSVCARLLDLEDSELAAEVSKYADSSYGVIA